MVAHGEEMKEHGPRRYPKLTEGMGKHLDGEPRALPGANEAVLGWKDQGGPQRTRESLFEYLNRAIASWTEVRNYANGVGNGPVATAATPKLFLSHPYIHPHLSRVNYQINPSSRDPKQRFTNIKYICVHS